MKNKSNAELFLLKITALVEILCLHFNENSAILW